MRPISPPHEIRTPPPHPTESAPHHPTPRNPHPTTAISRGPRDRDSAGTPGPRFRGDPGSGVGFCGPRSRPGGRSLRSSAPPPDLGHLDDESLADYLTDALAARPKGNQIGDARPKPAICPH